MRAQQACHAPRNGSGHILFLLATDAEHHVGRASVDRSFGWAYHQSLTVPITSALGGAFVENQVDDQPVLTHIQHLVAEEHRLHEQGVLPKADRKRLAQIQVELDQCWDLLRQRRALRDVGLDPDEAEVRPPQVVENYEQ